MDYNCRAHQAVWVALLAFVAASCYERTPTNSAKEDDVKKAGAQFSHADVKLLLDDKIQVVNLTKRVDKAAAERLASFFPGLGTGQTSRRAGSWIADVQIQFHRPEGGMITVTSSYEDWQEGANGDLPVQGDLRSHVNALFAESKRSPSLP